MKEIIAFLIVAFIFFIFGLSAGRRNYEKNIKRLELANRILREELDSEKKKTATLRELIDIRRNPYAQN